MLEWVFRRCDGEADAVETSIGLVPAEGGLNVDGLDVTAEDMELLTRVDDEAVRGELDQVKAHLDKFGDKLPAEIRQQLDALEQRLG